MIFRELVILCVVSFILWTLCLWDVDAQRGGSSSTSGGRSARRRSRGRNRCARRRGLPPHLRAVWEARSLGAGTDQTHTTDLSSLIPSQPPSAEADCYVEVFEKTTRAGRCIELGTRRKVFACQAGSAVEVANVDCINRPTTASTTSSITTAAPSTSATSAPQSTPSESPTQTAGSSDTHD